MVFFAVLDEGAADSEVTYHGYFTDLTAYRTLESLRHCGWTGDDLLHLEGLDSNEVQLVVEDEEHDGKMRTKVQWVNRAGGLAVKQPLSPERAHAFAASMQARIRALDAANGRRQPRPTAKPVDLRPEPPPLTDADMPF